MNERPEEKTPPGWLRLEGFRKSCLVQVSAIARIYTDDDGVIIRTMDGGHFRVMPRENVTPKDFMETILEKITIAQKEENG